MTEASVCKSTQQALWDLSAGALNEEQSTAVSAHLDECRECRMRRAEVRSLRGGLRSLPKVALSPLLETRLRVIASREHSRHMLRRDIAARFHDALSRLRLVCDNLLKPLAVPAAGGILASVLCIGIIVNTLQYQPNWQRDMPIGLFTEASLEDVSPFGCNGEDVTVEITVDAEGRVTDYSLPRGAASSAELLEIGNLVLYSKFTPAVSFGQPVPATFLVDIHHVTVRG